MFGRPHYYHQLLRGYVALFGTLFNDIYVKRYNAVGDTVQTLHVPIAFASMSKWFIKVDQDENLDATINYQVPAMSFDLVSYSRAVDRQSIPIHRITRTRNRDIMYSNFKAVPWEFGFELNVLTNNENDALQIFEQIVPFFTPDWTIRTRLLPNELEESDIVVISLSDAHPDRKYIGETANRKDIMWTYNFIMNAPMYGPTTNSGPIKRVQVDLHAVGGSGKITDQEILVTPRHERLVTTPGLTANGTPTSNSAEAIDWHLVEASDNYGYVEEVFSYIGDSKKYDPVSGNDVPIDIS